MLCQVINIDLFNLKRYTINNNNNNNHMDNKEPTLEEKQTAILTWIAVDFSDDLIFLQKINRLTFGLLKQNNLSIREQ